MKRCPVCEFIYEDEQSLCDMDNMELVALPHEQSASFESIKPPPKNRHRRKLLLLALSGILGLVLFFQYYKGELAFELTSNQAAVESFDAPVAPARSDDAPQPLASPKPSVSPSLSPSSTTRTPAKVTRAETEPQETTMAKNTPPVSNEVKRAPAVATSAPPATQTQRARPPQKEQSSDSKVSSILKKTANVLKKPFKF
jgi:hypothetical protein